MTKVITGKIINTSFGKMVIHNEQDEHLYVGEKIIIDGTIREILCIIPPSKPESKWALMVS